jgi:hypothetical protein
MIATMSTVRSASVIRMRRSLCRHVRGSAKRNGRQRADEANRHLQLIAERGRMGWQRVSGYNWRALVEADIGRYKRVIGDALRSRTKGRQMTRGRHCCRLAKPDARAWAAEVRSPHVNVAAGV